MGVHWERMYSPETLAKMNLAQILSAKEYVSYVLQNYRDNAQGASDEAMIILLEAILTNILNTEKKLIEWNNFFSQIFR